VKAVSVKSFYSFEGMF